MDISQLTVTEIAQQVQNGDLSATRIAEDTLNRVAKGRSLNAFLNVSEEALLSAAQVLDARRAAGESLGPLCGVPIGIKDALCTMDAPTTAGSRILTRGDTGGRPDPATGWRAPYDATVVERLRRADALIVGKMNMDEFAMGSSTENSAFGPTLNPWDHSRTPGGSSGGSAVGVAAAQVPASLGSDTGGSIRQPAGLCGVVGVKPSYGRVSRYGLIAFASSLDQVGPFANDVSGAARVLRVIAGHDARDSTSSPLPVGDYEAACGRGVAGLRIGIPKQYFGAGLDAAVGSSLNQSIEQLQQAGATLVEVDMPHTDFGVATYYILATAEASSNLARFDGVRFGLRKEEAGQDLQSLYRKTRGAGFGAEVKRRIMLGTYVLSAGYYDAYYTQAQRVRTLIVRDFQEAFSKVDVLATPCSPTPAFALGEQVDDPLQMYLQDVFTLPASLAGVCGISVPIAMTPTTPTRPSLPVGLQIIGPAFGEERMFQVAACAEASSSAPRSCPR